MLVYLFGRRDAGQESMAQLMDQRALLNLKGVTCPQLHRSIAETRRTYAFKNDSLYLMLGKFYPRNFLHAFNNPSALTAPDSLILSCGFGIFLGFGREINLDLRALSESKG